VIPVQEQLEPSDFSKSVRKPGAAFLQEVARPTNWYKKEYWQRALPALYQAYIGICAYSAHWIPNDTGVATVDHFVPKSTTPRLAYEWSNFRLASLKMNSRKGNHQDVLAPFKLKPNWFIMDFPSLLIKSNPILSVAQSEQVQATIKRLKLNDDDTCVRSRKDWLLPFCKKECTFELLKRHAPFIAYELQRQGLIDKIASIMGL
jgi:hypothetical protein